MADELKSAPPTISDANKRADFFGVDQKKVQPRLPLAHSGKESDFGGSLGMGAPVESGSGGASPADTWAQNAK
jgi:hypothetical protein